MPGRGFWGTTKPPPGVQLDRSSPLLAGAAQLCAFNELYGGRANDLYVGAPLTLKGNASFAPGGLLCATGTSDGAEITLPEYLKLARPVTLACYMTQLGTPVAGAGLWGLPVNNADTGPWLGYAVAIDGTGYYVAQTASGSAYNGLSSTVSGASMAGKTFTLVGVFGETFVNLYLNEDLIASITATYATPAFTATALISAGSYTGIVNRGSNAVIRLGLVSRRAWSFQEVASFAAAPYQMFAPPVWRRYFVPPAAALSPPVVTFPTYRMAR